MPLQPKVPAIGNNIKVKFVFQEGNRKWSEVHWAPQGGAGSLPAVLLVAKTIAALRADLLARTAQFVRVELSCPAESRNTLRDASVATYGRRASNANAAGNTVRVLFAAGNLNRASCYIGGVPDYVIASGVVTAGAGATWSADLRTYCTGLVNAGWGFVGRQKLRATAPRVPIQSVQNTAGALQVVTVITREPHNLPAGGNLVARVGGVQGATLGFPVNQQWYVNMIDDKTFSLNGMPLLTQVYQLFSSGYAQWQINVFHPYNNFVIDQPDTRKRGVRTEEPPARKKFKRTIGF